MRKKAKATETSEAPRLVYDQAEVADMIGVPLDTLRYWRRIEFGPVGFRLGRRVVYTVPDVQAWLADKKADDLAARRGGAA